MLSADRLSENTPSRRKMEYPSGVVARARIAKRECVDGASLRSVSQMARHSAGIPAAGPLSAAGDSAVRERSRRDPGGRRPADGAPSQLSDGPALGLIAAAVERGCRGAGVSAECGEEGRLRRATSTQNCRKSWRRPKRSIVWRRPPLRWTTCWTGCRMVRRRVLRSARVRLDLAAACPSRRSSAEWRSSGCCRSERCIGTETSVGRKRRRRSNRATVSAEEHGQDRESRATTPAGRRRSQAANCSIRRAPMEISEPSSSVARPTEAATPRRTSVAGEVRRLRRTANPIRRKRAEGTLPERVDAFVDATGS